MLCAKLGMGLLGTVIALDGTKITANAVQGGEPDGGDAAQAGR